MTSSKFIVLSLSAAVLASCSGDAGLTADEATGSAVAAIESLPPGVLCVRLTLRGTTRSFDTAGLARFELGALAPGSMSVTGAAYTVACSAVTSTTTAAWVSDPISVNIVAGLTTDFVLVMRPNSNVGGRIDFVQPAWSIAAGGNTTFAVMRDGSLRGWGENSYSHLGIGGTTDRNSPQLVGFPTTAQSVAVGELHACALTGTPGVASTGEVYCWGNNGIGQCGTGSVSDSVPFPSVTSGGRLFRNVAAGKSHSCGETGAGEVYCWGRNFEGQLADGSLAVAVVPRLAMSGVVFASLSLGNLRTSALMRDGSTRWWGSGLYGEFGVPASSDNETPVTGSYAAVTSIAQGGSHVCVVRADGRVFCAGRDNRGQLGDGAGGGEGTVAVSGLSDVIVATAGSEHTCALRRDGTVFCWGRNDEAQLGTGDGVSTDSPMQVRGLSGVTNLASGDFHTCAQRNDGTVWCWGRNDHGQLGNGTFTNAFVPVRVQL
jgi:alpha-tubulin suppressor-like RCC1 family protein